MSSPTPPLTTIDARSYFTKFADKPRPVQGLLFYHGGLCTVRSDGYLTAALHNPANPVYTYLIFEANGTIQKIVTDLETGYVRIVAGGESFSDRAWVLEPLRKRGNYDRYRDSVHLPVATWPVWLDLAIEAAKGLKEIGKVMEIGERKLVLP